MKILKETEFSPFNSENSVVLEAIGLTAPIKSSKYSIALTKLKLGDYVMSHYHKISEEIYIFIKGNCVMKINGKFQNISEGDIVLIEIDDVHEILPCNEEVAFYAVSFPPFLPEDFIS